MQSKGHSVFTALQIGLQSVRMYPVRSAFLLLATVTQGALQGYLVRRAEILTAEQVARLAAGTEHPDGHGGHQDR